MEVKLKRDEWGWIDTPGTLSVNGAYQCRTIEDRVREDAFRPVEEWKVKHRTAIPSGRFRLIAEDSPQFGPDTLTIVGVPGYDFIRMHAGNDEGDTSGCPLVGQRLEREADDGSWRVVGGTSRQALDELKAKLVPAIKAGEPCWITVENPDEWILAGGHRREEGATA